MGAWGRCEDRRERPFDTKASAQRPVRDPISPAVFRSHSVALRIGADFHILTSRVVAYLPDG